MELLVVIVVIAVVAAISIVAYNGVQQRARDSERRSDFAHLQKALEMYLIDNDQYRHCGATNTAAVSSCEISGLSARLAPKYMAQVPQDPVNVTNQQYFYARGWKKSSATGHVRTDSYQDYSMGTKLETEACGCSGAWGSQVNFMVGNS